MPTVDDALEYIDRVLSQYENLRKFSGGLFRGAYNSEDAAAFTSAATQCIHNVAGATSIFAKHANTYVERTQRWDDAVTPLQGVLRSLRSAVEHGDLKSLGAQIREETYGDILDSADRLLEDDIPGYKSAAAVLAGGVLEEHLRKLCELHGIPTVTERNAKLRPKTTDSMNSDLARADAYTQSTQKLITGWTAIRNDAAHAHHDKVNTQNVAIMIQGVRAFISQCPA